MKNIFLSILILALTASLEAQTIQYKISFENAVHHEAGINALFPDLEPGIFSVRMGRSSPGRYAIHEFAKNVYNFKATDSHGKVLQVNRPNPYQWDITGHNGEVNISYTLYADRGDGTYAQVDETHAHLNIPATFMYAPKLMDREIIVDFKLREDLDWQVATQMEKLTETRFRAPNFQYFMDSPVEISNFSVRQFEVVQNGKPQ
ncbi:MAG TPA: hypothetical protein VLZ54_06725, partial [Arenibacter sp.]|nr:hypothetical protein [Arenibacter sp.]